MFVTERKGINTINIITIDSVAGDDISTLKYHPLWIIYASVVVHSFGPPQPSLAELPDEFWLNLQSWDGRCHGRPRKEAQSTFKYSAQGSD